MLRAVEITGLPDGETDSFDDFPPPPMDVRSPAELRIAKRATKIARSGFCDGCSDACARGEAEGFDFVDPVCSDCRGGLVPVNRRGSVRVAYRAQRWAAG